MVAPTAGRPGKQGAADFVADDDNRALLRVVKLVDPTAFVSWQVTNLVEVGRNPHDLSAGLVEIAHRANVSAGDGGRGRGDAGTVGKDVLVIIVSEVVLA